MKLQQDQIWNRGGEYLRIVRLERLAVEYKSSLNLWTKDGTHLKATKKEFCRLLKGAVLLTPAEIKALKEPAGLVGKPPPACEPGPCFVFRDARQA